MTLPALVGPIGLLPPGRHPATLADLEAVFVAAAPFTAERRLIFDALTVWTRQTAAILPGARCWIDGGFVTHKPWAAPDDVDVVVIARPADVNALSPAVQAQLANNLTRKDVAGIGHRPMGGLVDAYIAPEADPDRLTYWEGFWSRVRLNDGSVSDNETKGYVEVIL